MLFFANSATGEIVWAPTSDEEMPSSGPTGEDVDLKSCPIFMESPDTTEVSDSPNTLDALSRRENEELKRY